MLSSGGNDVCRSGCDMLLMEKFDALRRFVEPAGMDIEGRFRGFGMEALYGAGGESAGDR